VRSFAGTTVRLLVFLAITVALVSVPLVVVYRSRCPDGDGRGRETRWTFVAPWDDPPRECRKHENGFEVIRDELGLD
jgi:hypothetical protein